MYTNEQLLSPDFDPDAYLKYMLHVENTSTEQKRLTDCLDEVRKNIHAILSEHSDSMIADLKASHKAQRSIVGARQSTDSILKATSRLRLMIEEPYLAIRDKIEELERTRTVLHALRQVQRFLSLSTRLEEQNSTTDADLIHTAHILSEMQELAASSAVRGIDVVEARFSLMERTTKVLRSKIHELLAMKDILSPLSEESSAKNARSGVETTFLSLNKVVLDVGTALQCSFTLGSLSSVVHSFMMEHKREVIKIIVHEMDYHAIAHLLNNLTDSKATTHSSPEDNAKRLLDAQSRELMDRIQIVLYAAVRHTQCILVLWWVLLWKQDAVTRASLVTMLEEPVPSLMNYWNAIMDKLRQELLALQKQANLQAVLTNSYSRLHMLLESFVCSSGSFMALGAQQWSEGASLVLHRVREWGMGDYLDLVQHVEAEVNKLVGKCESLSSTAADKNAGVGDAIVTNIERIRQTWLFEIVKGVQLRFVTEVMRRHQGQLLPALTALSVLTPSSVAAGNQAISVSANGAVTSGAHQVSRVPVLQPNTIELTSYTHSVIQECYMYRKDPHTLLLLMESILKCLAQLYAKLKESAAQFPLIPFPVLTSVATKTQWMHISIANACTILVNDFTNLFALLPEYTETREMMEAPETSHDRASGDDLGTVAGDWIQALRMLSFKRRALQRQLQAFRLLSEESSSPFLNAIDAVLGPSLSLCIEDYLSDLSSDTSTNPDSVRVLPQLEPKPPVILQLQKSMDGFMTHFYAYFDPRTWNWADKTQQVIDSKLARLVVSLAVCVRGVETQDARAWCRSMIRCITQVEPILLSFKSSEQECQGRSTLLLRSMAHRLVQFYIAWSASLQQVQEHDQAVEQLQSILKPLHPVVSRLLLLQRLSFTSRKMASENRQANRLSVMDALGCGSNELVEQVEAGLLHHCDASFAGLTKAAETQLEQIKTTLQSCFDILMRGVQDQEEGKILAQVWQRL